MSDRINELRSSFRKTFGTDPARVVKGPGRVDLLGTHTDYNGGYVLPVAVDLGTYLMIRRSELSPARLFSENVDLDARILTAEVKRDGDWADYVRGVYLYAQEYCGALPPFDALYFGDLPLRQRRSPWPRRSECRAWAARSRKTTS